MRHFVQDCLHGFSLFHRDRVSAGVILCTLALGAGAAAAVVAVANAVWFRPLPYRHPGQLVSVYERSPAQGLSEIALSADDYLALKEASTCFAGIGTFEPWAPALQLPKEAPALSGASVSPDVFALLQVKPFLGRAFLPSDEVAGYSRVGIISYNLWRGILGADPNILGKQLKLQQGSGESSLVTVIGVMPQGFTFPSPLTDSGTDIWRTESSSAHRQNPKAHFLGVIGRLSANCPLSKAQTQADTISRHLRSGNSASNSEWSIQIIPLINDILGGTRQSLVYLLLAAGFVLLMCCLNIAGILLARSTVRQREMTIRAVLGATPSRLVQQLIAENLAFSLAGIPPSILVSYGVARFAKWLNPANIPRLDEFHLDWVVLAITVGICLGTWFMFGLIPAFSVLRRELTAGLHGDTGLLNRRATALAVRRVIVATEMAFAVVLLVSAYQMVRGFNELNRSRLGFDVNNVLTGSISLPRLSYSESSKRLEFSRELTDRIKGLPGVIAAAVARSLPGGPEYAYQFSLEAQSSPRQGVTEVRTVSPSYFNAFEVELIRGREFGPSDNSQSEFVAVVNATLARANWPHGNPIGEHIHIPMLSEQAFTIIGVVHDTLVFDRYGNHTNQVYISNRQLPFGGGFVIVRSNQDPSSLQRSLEEVITTLDPTLRFENIKTLGELKAESLSEPRLRAAMLGTFSILALLLCIAGVYGIMSQFVSQKNRDIAIRMAIGASSRNVLFLVMKEAAILTASGLLIGGLMSVASTRLIESVVGTNPGHSNGAYVIACGILLFISCLGTLIPAMRAVKIAPYLQLKSE